MTDVFETGPYDSFNGGYPVKRVPEAGGCVVARFICESEARYFCDFANAQVRKHDTTDMAQWDAGND